MTRDPIAIVILAAGRGTRMGGDLPKVLHPLGQVPLLHHAMTAARALEPERLIVVTGHGAAAVEAAAKAHSPDAITVHQAEQLGTGHAAAQALPALEGFEGRIIVLYGDTPFVSAARLAEMADTPAGRGGAGI